jgi:hypothetical protein
MPGKPLPDESKRERALKLLGETDSALAEVIRDKLKGQDEDQKQPSRILRLPVDPSIIPPRFTIKKAAFTLPQLWPLSIDKSFWEDWAFVKWQALRRNPFYRSSIKRFYKPNPAIFQSSQISHLFQDYSPSFGPAENPFSVWRTWAIHRSLRMKTSERIEIEITERLLAKDFTIKRVDLWPVLPAVCFPHPYFLDKLRPLPFAIPIEPVNHKDKVPPYAALAETGLRKPKYLRLDISLPKDVLRRVMVDYLRSLKVLNLKPRDSDILTPEARRKRVEAHLLRQIPRRFRSLHAPIVPYWFCVWDLRQAGLKFPQIAGCLFPKEYVPNDPDSYPSLRAGEKYEAIQRVQDYYDQAKLLIDLIINPPASSIT